MAEGRTAWPPVEGDWFVEPPAATEFLLNREDFAGGIWDPACGRGNIVLTCLARGLPAVGSDIKARERAELTPWWLGYRDFTKPGALPPIAKNVVSNPPYGRAKLAEEFCRKAVALKGVRKVAMFLNSKFLFSDGRALGIYALMPPDRIYPVRPRPSCPPGEFLLGGGKAEGGVENFVWIVWDVADPSDRTEFIWS